MSPQLSRFSDNVQASSYIPQGPQLPGAPTYGQSIRSHGDLAAGHPEATLHAQARAQVPGPGFTLPRRTGAIDGSQFPQAPDPEPGVTAHWWNKELRNNKLRIQVLCADRSRTDFLAIIDLKLERSQILSAAAVFMNYPVRPLPKRKRSGDGDTFAQINVVATEYGPVQVKLNIVVKDDIGEPFVQLRLAPQGLSKLGLLNINAYRAETQRVSTSAAPRNEFGRQIPDAVDPDCLARRTRARIDAPRSPPHNLVMRSRPNPQFGPEHPSNGGAAWNAGIPVQFSPTLNDMHAQDELHWTVQPLQHTPLSQDDELCHHMSPTNPSPTNNEASHSHSNGLGHNHHDGYINYGS